eukprot:92261_1
MGYIHPNHRKHCIVCKFKIKHCMLLGVATIIIYGVIFAKIIRMNTDTTETMPQMKTIDDTHTSHDDSLMNVTNLTVFTLIGTEGTGHHVFKEIFDKMSAPDISTTSNTTIIMGREHNKLIEYCCSCAGLTRGHIKRILRFTKHFYRKKPSRNKSTLLFFTTSQQSYPCGVNFTFPNMTGLVKLIEEVNEAQPKLYHITLRFIVLRREYVETMSSSCIHRFGDCQLRTQLLYKAIFLIDQDLRTMHHRYWIMIDFNELLKNPLDYAQILSVWLNINDVELMRHGLSAIDTSIKHASSLQKSWQKLRKWDRGVFLKPVPKYWREAKQKNITHIYKKQNMSFELESTVRKMFYYDDKVNQTVLHNECALVAPRNTAFMKPHVTCNLQ